MPEHKQFVKKEITNIWRFSEAEVLALLRAAVGSPKGEIEFECDELVLRVRTSEFEQTEPKNENGE